MRTRPIQQHPLGDVWSGRSPLPFKQGRMGLQHRVGRLVLPRASRSRIRRPAHIRPQSNVPTEGIEAHPQAGERERKVALTGEREFALRLR